MKTSGTPLVSADLSAEVGDSRVWQFDVNGDTNSSDQLVVTNPDSTVFKTILDVDGVTFQIAATGVLANGDTFDLIDADQIVGTPIITSVNAAQTWTFIPGTGQVRLGGAGVPGDHDGDGTLDAQDLDLLAVQMVLNTPSPPAGYDLNSDGKVNYGDRLMWLHDLFHTWVGDANLDKVFNSQDCVQVFAAGKYETGAASLWGEGDWNGDQVFDSRDFVAAFADGGYEAGPRPGAVSAVPEPSSMLLALVALLGLAGLTRRR